MIDIKNAKGSTKSKRLRSPPYPFIALPKAIERAKSLYEKAGHREVGLEVLGEAWGYGAKSSGLVQTASALMQFGLLVDRGSREARKFQLTPQAIRILEATDPGSEEHLALLQRCALRPRIFAELAHRIGGAEVPDSALKDYLREGRRESGEPPYGDDAAEDVVARYKASISLAGMDLDAKEQAPSTKAEGRDEKSQIAVPAEVHANRTGLPGAVPTLSGSLAKGAHIWDSGPLGPGKSYEIIVRGVIGLKEIELLIERLLASKRGFAEGTAVSVHSRS